jgi:hypothetical protein
VTVNSVITVAFSTLAEPLWASQTPQRKTMTEYRTVTGNESEIVTFRGRGSATWRCVMRTFIAAVTLISLIAIPSATQIANAAPVSPASSAFGGNGY